MSNPNTPAKATVEKVAAQLSVVPRRTSSIAQATGLSPSTTRRCLVVLAEAGRAAKNDDGDWINAKPPEGPTAPKTPKAAETTKVVEPKVVESNDVPDDSKIETVGVIDNDEATQYDAIKASAEYKALKAWVQSGRTGDRPDTTNYDALNAAHASGRPKVRKAKSNGNGAPRSKRGSRGQEAIKRQTELGNHRGKGRKVTDDELTDYVRKVREGHPESSCDDEHMFAYWIEGIANGRHRFARIWDGLDDEFASEAKSA